MFFVLLRLCFKFLFLWVTCIVLIVLFLLFLKNAKKPVIYKAVMVFTAILYLLFVLYVTLIFYRNNTRGINLIPFDRFIHPNDGYGNIFLTNDGYALLMNICNIFLFIPFGMLIPSIIRFRNRYIGVIISSALFSLLIEIMQFITKTGITDIDDLIDNILGAFLGLIIVNRIIKFMNARSNGESITRHE